MPLVAKEDLTACNDEGRHHNQPICLATATATLSTMKFTHDPVIPMIDRGEWTDPPLVSYTWTGWVRDLEYRLKEVEDSSETSDRFRGANGVIHLKLMKKNEDNNM